MISDEVKSAFICTSNPGKARELRAALAGPLVFGLGDLSASQRRRFVEPVEDGATFFCNGLKKLAAALSLFVDDQGRQIQLGPTDVCPDVVVVDDSGLCVPALGFVPGVHSAYFAGMPRDDGRNLLRLAEIVAAQEIPGAGSHFPPTERRLEAFFVCSLMAIDLRRLLGTRDAGWRKDIVRTIGDIAAQGEGSLFARPAWEREIFEAARAQKSEGLCPKLPLLSDTAAEDSELIKICYGFVWGAVSSVAQELLPGEGHGYDPIFYPDALPSHSFASISLEQKNEWSHRGRAAKLLRTQLFQ